MSPSSFFSTRQHSILLLSTDSRTLCYLILFGRRFTSTIRPMIPTGDKIQNSKSGNFTVRKMRSYWNFIWCVLNSLVIPSEDLGTTLAADCIALEDCKIQYTDTRLVEVKGTLLKKQKFLNEIFFTNKLSFFLFAFQPVSDVLGKNNCVDNTTFYFLRCTSTGLVR